MRTNVYIKCYTVEARKDFFTRRYTINWTFETDQEIGKTEVERTQRAPKGLEEEARRGRIKEARWRQVEEHASKEYPWKMGGECGRRSRLSQVAGNATK